MGPATVFFLTPSEIPLSFADIWDSQTHSDFAARSEAMTPFLVLAVVLLALAMGGYFLMHRPHKDDQEFYNFRCTGCKKKLRYQERQVGHQGRCPSCRKPITFPPTSQAIG